MLIRKEICDTIQKAPELEFKDRRPSDIPHCYSIEDDKLEGIVLRERPIED